MAQDQVQPQDSGAVQALPRQESSRFDRVAGAASGLMGIAERGLCYAAAAFLMFIMVFTSLDIVLRYVFNKPLEGSYELVSLIMVPVALFGISEAQAQNAHIRVAALQERLPLRARLLLETLTLLIMLGVSALLTWQAATYAIEAWRIGDLVMGISRLPTWHARAAVAVGTGCLSLRLVMQLARSVFRLVA